VAGHQELPAAIITSLSQALHCPVETLDLMRYFHSPHHAELKKWNFHVLSPLGLAIGKY
jgi:hypothetical protein